MTASRSPTGASWTFIGDEAITLPDDFYVGMAVASHAPNQLASAVFDHVTVRPAAPANSPPMVSLTSPASGTIALLGGSIALAATASDRDGSVAAVDFLVNGTLVGSDPATPYEATWIPAAAGGYTVTAVARDNANASTASAGAVVTITALPPRILTFEPSPDHDALVDFYQVEIFRAGATAEGALLVQNIGKPPIVDGSVSADIGPLLVGLAPGGYVAVVDAVGAAGIGPSDASPAFTR